MKNHFSSTCVLPDIGSKTPLLSICDRANQNKSFPLSLFLLRKASMYQIRWCKLVTGILIAADKVISRSPLCLCSRKVLFVSRRSARSLGFLPHLDLLLDTSPAGYNFQINFFQTQLCFIFARRYNSPLKFILRISTTSYTTQLRLAPSNYQEP